MPHKQEAEQRRQVGGTRRIMRAFKINEISLVDHPAQEGARVAIMKRKGEPGYDPDNPDPTKRGRNIDKVLPSPGDGESQEQFVSRFLSDSEAKREFPDKDQRLAVAFQRSRKRAVEKRALLTTQADDHSHLLIVDFETGEGARPAGMTEPALTPGAEMPHRHPWVMDDDGNVTIGAAGGHVHAEGELSVTGERAQMLLMQKAELSQEDILAVFKTASSGGSRQSQEKNDMSDDVQKAADLKAENEKLAKALEDAKAYGALNDAHKIFYKKLSDGDKAAFISKSEGDRAKLISDSISKAATENPVVYTSPDGTEYHKNDGERLITLAKQADQRLKKLEEAQKVADDLALRKRAESEFKHLPGDVDTHVVLLKAVGEIVDEKQRSAVTAALKAQNAAMASAFEVVGHQKVSKADLEGIDTREAAEAEMKKKAEELQKTDSKLSYYDAYEKVAQNNPQLYNKAVAG